MLTYQPTDWLSLGVGGRYWHLETDRFSGDSHFETSVIPVGAGNPQPVKFEAERYGVFLQGSVCLTCLVDKQYRTSDFSSPTARPASPATRISWTGPYVGLHAGYGFNNTSTSLSSDPQTPIFFSAGGAIPQTLTTFDDGFVGGGQIGYNHQLGFVVLGVEADASYAHLTGRNTISTGGGFFKLPYEQSISWFGTLRGRVGLLPVSNVLLYVAGGLAFGGTGATTSLLHEVAGSCANPFATCGGGSSSQTSIGWTVGGGFEYAITNNVTFKGEYLFVDLGDHASAFTFAAFGNPVIRAATNFEAHIARVGVNYKF